MVSSTIIIAGSITRLFCSVGDQLVSVNGMSVFAMNVDQVKGLLASIPGEEIKLVVLDGASAAAPFGCDDNLPSR